MSAVPVCCSAVRGWCWLGLTVLLPLLLVFMQMVMVMVFASSQLTFLGLFQVMPGSQRSLKVNLWDLLECSIPYWPMTIHPLCRQINKHWGSVWYNIAYFPYASYLNKSMIFVVFLVSLCELLPLLRVMQNCCIELCVDCLSLLCRLFIFIALKIAWCMFACVQVSLASVASLVCACSWEAHCHPARHRQSSGVLCGARIGLQGLCQTFSDFAFLNVLKSVNW